LGKYDEIWAKLKICLVLIFMFVLSLKKMLHPQTHSLSYGYAKRHLKMFDVTSGHLLVPF